MSVGVWFGEERREFVTEPGDLVVGDLTTPFASKPRANFDSDVWLFPRRLFDPHVLASLHPNSLVLAGHSGLSGMVKAYLDAFAGQIDALDDREVDMLADNFCRLLAVVCGGIAGEHEEAIRVARLEEAKRHIDQNLADPNLTPEKAARALKISVRRLHLLFEPSGTTFAQYVLRRRLEECRATLMNPIASRSIIDVAFAWGFNSLATFYRTFHEAFGMAPGALRAEANRPRGARSLPH